MRQAATDGSPVADRGMRDMGNSFRQQRRVRGDFRRSLKIDMTGQRTNSESTAGDGNAAQLRKLADIDLVSACVCRQVVAAVR